MSNSTPLQLGEGEEDEPKFESRIEYSAKVRNNRYGDDEDDY